MSTGIIVLTVVLLLANAFFVGAEFAAMAARRSRLEPLAEAGNLRARSTLAAMENMGAMLACAQLGITICSVLLGAISEASLHYALVPVVERLGWPAGVTDTLALGLSLLVVVYLHVVVGEMIPKNLAIAGPDRTAMIMVPALFAITRALRWPIRVMEGIAKAIVRRLGVEPRDEVASQFTAQEVAHIVTESHREGLVATAEFGRLGAALEFSDKNAADVGVPISQLVTLSPGATPADVERLVAKRGFSRFPVLDGSGEVRGYLHLKDVLYADEAEREQPVPAKRIRHMATVRPTDEVEAVLRSMQHSGSHLARVVDEAGVLVAVVFFEDVIEELVGEVTDASQRS